MIGKCCVAAALLFAGAAAAQTSTTLDVPIVITHGAPVTTFTFVNDSGKTLPAGSPVSFGQAFRYGDVMPGNQPVIRDAATHVALAGQQWDEISTWRENGGNGSWRHAVWAAWLPKDLANGATYQVEFVATAGAYSQSSHQALSALCSGPAAHDLKFHLTDMRNQDDTVRDSGNATFRLCDNIANVGRDAPRHLRAGNVYDEYQVNGMFVYSGTGDKDPLLYAQCNVDIFTKAADGVSPGDVRWVCHAHNSWENVAAGSAGNARNPGPAGFPNDPQTVSYRAEIDDGSTSVLDWSGLDATVNSADNPIHLGSSVGCQNGAGTYCMFVPSSTDANQWYYGQATRVSCSGTCVAGLTNGQLYYVWPSSSAASAGANTQYVALITTPNGDNPAIYQMTATQGTGSTSFSTRIQHYHWLTWQTLDWTGQDNWSPIGTQTRVTRKVYPAFTSAEKRYWQQSGLIMPMDLNQAVNDLTPPWGSGGGPNYGPFARMTVIGGTQGGPRPDIGIVNEFASQALIKGTESAWDYARLFTLGTSIHGYSTLLDESTGRIPVLNNGPPTGPGGNGNGGPYTGLGTPQPATTWYPAPSGMANSSSGGMFGFGTYISHIPSFDGFTYAVFGDRHFLDMMRWQANRDFLQQRVGPGPELGQGYYRDNNAGGPDGKVYHYWGLLLDCCQTRGSSWMFRDITNPAAFGSDNDIERSYFNDFLVENRNYYPLWLAWKDGPGSTAYSTSIVPPNAPGGGTVVDTFQITYVFDAAWLMTTFLHEPLGSQWMTKYQRYYEGILGRQLAGAPVSPYWVIDYIVQPQIQNGDGFQSPSGGNMGQYMNGTDASDFGDFSTWTNIISGGQLSTNNYTLTAGDTLKAITGFVQTPKLDQLDGSRWYEIMGPIDNSAQPRTFYLKCTAADHVAFPAQCPVAGAAFIDFTRAGASITNETNFEQYKYRLSFDPGPGQGYADPNYVQYVGQTINGLRILGYNVAHALSDFTTRGGPGYYNSAQPSNFWDSTITIPGLPMPRNGL